MSEPVDIIPDEEVDADRLLLNMMRELAATMYHPVRILDNVTTSTVGCQAGYTCVECEATYCTSSGYRRHVREFHSLHAYTCRHCYASYVRMSSLRRHIMRFHTTGLVPT